MPTNRIQRKRVPRGAGSKQRAITPGFHDPFPGIQGSVPEKMVIAELVRRGIYFEHTSQSNPLPPPVDPTWEPDFLLPQFQIWLEVQGAYFHLQQASIESDAYRFAAIEAVGWRPIFWWDFDILRRLNDLMDEVPEFYMVTPAANQGMRLSEGYSFWEGGWGIDHLKGLRTQLAARRKPPKLVMRRQTRRAKK